MSLRRKLKLKRIRNVDKEGFQRETARLLEQFLQSDVDEPVPVFFGNVDSKDNDTGRSNHLAKHLLHAQNFGLGIKTNKGLSSDGWHHAFDTGSSNSLLKHAWFAQGCGDGVQTNQGLSSNDVRQVHISGGVNFSGDRENTSSPKQEGYFQTGAGDLTEDADEIQQGVLEGPRTEVEQELVQELRRIADDIDQNEKLKANVRKSIEDVTGLLVYSSFTSTVQQFAENLVGWRRLAFVFQFTKNAIQAAGRVGLNAMQIKENCLRYIADKSADWIVRQGGWASMLSGDFDDSTPELD